MDVQNCVAEQRAARGLSVSALATAIGVSRQTVYAIEAGTYTPNTAVALRLAQALGVTVDDIFKLETQPASPLIKRAELLEDERAASTGVPVCLCEVDGRLIASYPEQGVWSLPLADAIVTSKPLKRGSHTTTSVELIAAPQDFEQRLLMAGCDPAISILGRHLQQQDVNMVVAHINSTKALELLHKGKIHVAGCHISDDNTSDSNLATIGRMFKPREIAIISFALWEEGLVVASGNPKRICEVADLVRSDVTIVNREPGAGSRLLLDSRLRKLGMAHKSVRGYERIANGHLPAARLVQSGEADCCVATLSVAHMLRLAFVPLISSRYDFVVHRRHLKLPQVQVLFNTLAQAAFRRELEHLGGYDTSVAGNRLM